MFNAAQRVATISDRRRWRIPAHIVSIAPSGRSRAVMQRGCNGAGWEVEMVINRAHRLHSHQPHLQSGNGTDVSRSEAGDHWRRAI